MLNKINSKQSILSVNKTIKNKMIIVTMKGNGLIKYVQVQTEDNFRS